MVEPLDFIDALLASNSNSIVIIDEAYADFAGQTAIPLLDKYDNLIITRTFSKARSLAGIRLGVALGSPLAISKLYDVKNSFNSYCVDYVAQEVGLASINDQTLVDLNIAKIIATRNWFGKELEKLGFVITDSQTNFVFIQSPLSSAKNLYEKMYEAHIIIRYWDKPRISNWVRITIGTEEEMRNVLAFLAEFIQQEKMNNSIGIN
ncbi:pyridoxal phosphate-dependent aminotransferase [Lactococcus fujiensis]|uniref:pyridoxal phosphate-dependent aminotransferase n=1 Tax=Lactococcus fujiensis TaxID=610251 RepID=UPI00278BCE29|nr:histidinol-phosphate transaminase [Lactococcus fujiensis]